MVKTKMKVIKSGYLLYDRQRLLIIGWTFDCKGKEVNINEMLEAIFNHIKENSIIGLDSNKFANKKVES